MVNAALQVLSNNLILLISKRLVSFIPFYTLETVKESAYEHWSS